VLVAGEKTDEGLATWRRAVEAAQAQSGWVAEEREKERKRERERTQVAASLDKPNRDSVNASVCSRASWGETQRTRACGGRR